MTTLTTLAATLLILTFGMRTGRSPATRPAYFNTPASFGQERAKKGHSLIGIIEKENADILYVRPCSINGRGLVFVKPYRKIELTTYCDSKPKVKVIQQ